MPDLAPASGPGVNVVGVSANFHDSACCLLKDGRLVAAAQEERFTRIKHDPAIPQHAFRFCLREGGVDITGVDCVAFYENPRAKLARQLWSGLPKRAARRPIRLDPGRPLRDIREVLGYDGPVEFVDHHLSHAASAFFFSGFRDAAILTVDGVGEWATTTYGRGCDDSIELFEEVHFPDSIGLLYSAVTAYLGFEVNDGEYKVMGLAPYGDPLYTDRFRTLLRPRSGGQYTLDMEYFEFLDGDRMFSDRFCELFGQPPRARGAGILPFHEDVARSLQVVLEETLLEKVAYLRTKVPSENLCLAGGVALNCVANGRILREGPFERLFVQPAADDSGAALGAAAMAHRRLTGRRVECRPLESVLLGPGYTSEEIGRLLSATSVRRQDFRGDERGLLEATVDRLTSGRIVGWFHGRMEFGPRALGARSILADPRDPSMRDRINAMVKQRESFRPFAPAVLHERARDHFALDCASPFMLLVAEVTSPLDLPAITHVDRSARVQTVHREHSPRFAALIDAFERRSGCPLLLNTSFNVRGEPIVCRPFDALLCFVRSGLDCLVLEDFLIDRPDMPTLWPHVLRHLQDGDRSGVEHDVYTLW